MGAQKFLRTNVGGGGKATFYTISTLGTATAEAFVLDRIVSTAITGTPLQGNVQVEFDGKVNNEAFNTFLETYLSATPVEATQETYEDGNFSNISSGGATATKLLMMYYEAPDADDAKTAVHKYVGYLGGATGNKSFSANATAVTPIQFIGNAFVDADVTIPDTFYDTDKVSGAATSTIASNSVGDVEYLTTA